MPLTRDFKETVQARVQHDPAFRRALLREAVETMIDGDVNTGKAVLRDYINATKGFVELGRSLDKSPKSLMRMLGPSGNPGVQNMFAIISRLRHKEGIRFAIKIHNGRSFKRNRSESESVRR